MLKPTPELKSKFGKELTKIMNKNSLSNKDLGDLLSRPSWRISDFVRGKVLPTYEELEKMCDLMNVTKEVFFPDGMPTLNTDNEYLLRSRAKSISKFVPTKTIGKPLENEVGIDLDVENEIPAEPVGAKDDIKEFTQEACVPVNAGQNVLIPELAVPVKEEKTEVKETPKNLENIEKFQEIIEKNEKKQVISKKIEIKIPSMNENQSISIIIEEVIR